MKLDCLTLVTSRSKPRDQIKINGLWRDLELNFGSHSRMTSVNYRKKCIQKMLFSTVEVEDDYVEASILSAKMPQY